MKTHDFAKQLMIMAKILRSAPDVDLSEYDASSLMPKPSDTASVSPADIPKALNMLVGLNNVPKQQWITLINQYSFKIEIRARDANRDIYGKLLKYLSDHPDERNRLIGRKTKQSSNVSTELADALTILLK